MGSPWNERREDDGPDRNGPGTRPTPPGLAAAELDLLRQAPDYDAEEMASVRPSGGYAAVLDEPAKLGLPAVAPAAGATEQPAAPSWLPPNRINPPSRLSAPADPFPKAAAPVEIAARSAGEAGRLRFPEERTVALLAEDLLGRALDEPAKPASRPAAAHPGGLTPPAGGSGGYPGNVGTNTGGADIWDAAMPLVAEG